VGGWGCFLCCLRARAPGAGAIRCLHLVKGPFSSGTSVWLCWSGRKRNEGLE
jgi:hypothetical protein